VREVDELDESADEALVRPVVRVFQFRRPERLVLSAGMTIAVSLRAGACRSRCRRSFGQPGGGEDDAEARHRRPDR
jgi:hypothetical protein